MDLPDCDYYAPDTGSDNISLAPRINFQPNRAEFCIYAGGELTKVVCARSCKLNLTGVPSELMAFASLAAECLNDVADIVAETVGIDYTLEAFERNVEPRPTCFLR